MTNTQKKEDEFEIFKLAEEEKIKHEGIIDQFIVRNISFNIIQTLEKNNISPNMITTLSLITGCIAIWCVLKEYYIYGSLFFCIRYILDCIDGPLARYTKTTSEFGDKYDHIVDSFSFFGMLLAIATRGYSKYFYIGCVLLTITTVLHHTILTHKNIHNSTFITQILQYLPINEKYFGWTQYFSTDIITFYMCLAIVIDKKCISCPAVELNF